MQAVIGIGSNMGNSESEIFQAIHWLGQGHRLLCHSSLYRSAPLGVFNQDDFINAVAVIDTEQTPQVLLMTMLDYEKRGEENVFLHMRRGQSTLICYCTIMQLLMSLILSCPIHVCMNALLYCYPFWKLYQRS